MIKKKSIFIIIMTTVLLFSCGGSVEVSEVEIQGSLSYDPLIVTYGNGGSITPTFTNTLPGQTVTYSMTPVSGGSLPEGISIDDSSGDIFVSDSANVMTNTEFTVTATGTGDYEGSINTSIFITINSRLIEGEVSYNALRVVQGNEGSSEVPVWTGDFPGQTVIYSITTNALIGSLPSGIAINSNNGVITVDSITEFMNEYVPITATGVSNFAGEIETTISISVVQGIQGSLSYDPLIVTYGNGGSITPTFTDALPGQTVTYSMNPTSGGSLPEGISIDDSSGDIFVSDSANVMTNTEFTVTATGTGDYGGSINTSIFITINSRPIEGTLIYNFLAFTYGVGGSSIPTLVNGVPDQTVTYSITPTSGGSLPEGISFDPDQGGITVSKTATIMSNNDFIITTTGEGNFSGVLTTTVSISIEFLRNITNIKNVPGGTIKGAYNIANAVVDGTNYLFIAEQSDNQVSVFSVDDTGTLVHIQTVTDNNDYKIFRVVSLTTTVIGDTTYLIAAGRDDNGVSIFRVGSGGTLSHVQSIADDDTYQIKHTSSVTTLTIGNSNYLFVTGQLDDGVSVFSLNSDGHATYIQSVTNDDINELDGASSSTTAVIAGTNYLFVTGRSDFGMSVFSVDNSGYLTHIDSVTDTGENRMRGANSVTTTVINNTNYLFVTGFDHHAVNVFSVGSNGKLSFVQVVADDNINMLQYANSVTTKMVNGIPYLFVTSWEDHGFSVFSIGSNGILSHVQSIADNDIFNLYRTSSVKVQTIGSTIYLFVTGWSEGFSVFSVGSIIE